MSTLALPETGIYFASAHTYGDTNSDSSDPESHSQSGEAVFVLILRG